MHCEPNLSAGPRPTFATMVTLATSGCLKFALGCERVQYWLLVQDIESWIYLSILIAGFEIATIQLSSVAPCLIFDKILYRDFH